MKNLPAVPGSIRNSVVILRRRDVELDAADRRELHRNEVAFGGVFKLIHRIEWRFVGRPGEVELRCDLQALSGRFAATAVERNARAALQTVAQRILKQKRRAKTIAVSRRRAPGTRPPRTPARE